MFRPPCSLHFKIVDFLILGCSYFQMNLKIILLTSSIKESGVSSTLQTNVSFKRAKFVIKFFVVVVVVVVVVASSSL